MTVARSVKAIELSLLAVALLFVFTGSGAQKLDRLGARADAVYS